VQLVGSLAVPPKTDPLHPILLCFAHYISTPNSFEMDKIPKDIMTKFQKYPLNEVWSLREESQDLVSLSELFRLKIYVYRVQREEYCTIICPERTINPHFQDEIHLVTQRNNWAIILNLETFRNRIKCHTCGRWKKAKNIESFRRDHYNDCIRCGCQRSFKKGDVHPTTCRSQDCFRTRKKGKKDGEIKRAKKEKLKEIPFMDHQHFADFECFPQKDLNGKFIVYAGGLAVAHVKDVELYIGRNSLDDFMNRIFQLQGTLWFFNGSKFDNFFILEYLVQHKIPFNQEETVLCGRQVILLTIFTEKGTLVIKDLAKFFVGSLLSNCKSFGVDSSESKGEFDHDKMRSWANVEDPEIKAEVLDYLRLDVVSLRAIYEASAKVFADDFKLMMCKFVSLAQISFAISSLFIPDKTLYRSCIANGELEAIQATYFGMSWH
jgi:hypothetical protein